MNNLQHATTLSHAMANLTKSQRFGKHVVTVRQRDLDFIANGAHLLAQRIRSHHADLGLAVPALWRPRRRYRSKAATT